MSDNKDKKEEPVCQQLRHITAWSVGSRLGGCINCSKNHPEIKIVCEITLRGLVIRLCSSCKKKLQEELHECLV